MYITPENGACKTTKKWRQPQALLEGQNNLPVPLSASALTDRFLNRLEPLFAKAPAEEPASSPKRMTGSEIYSSFFNIQKLYPSDLGDDLRRYTYLSSDPARTAEEDAGMLRLQKKPQCQTHLLSWQAHEAGRAAYVYGTDGARVTRRGGP